MQARTRSHLPAARGQTLIDVMISMAIVSVGFAALVSAGVASSRTSTRSYRRFIAKELAHRRLNEILFADQKTARLPAPRAGTLDPIFTGAARIQKPFLPDVNDTTSWSKVPEAGIYYGAASGSNLDYVLTNDRWKGMVDIYGRPCSQDKMQGATNGYHPSCRYRRFVRFERVDNDAALGGPNQKAPYWRIQVAVSQEPFRTCPKALSFAAASPYYCSCDAPDTTPWCVFASAILSR